MKHARKISMISVFFSLSLFLVSLDSYAMGSRLPRVTPTKTPKVTPVVRPPRSTPPKIPTPEITPSPTTPVVMIPTTTVNQNYSFLDPDGIVPKSLLAKTLNYFDKNKAVIKNKNFIAIIDFKQHNSKERFYIIDMQSGHVERYLTAHGKNSDPDYDGYATIFSNTTGSEMSSQGFYLTAETYQGSHGLSLALDGLSTTNSNARSRAIVIHGATYVTPGSKIGRSWGCPALDMRYYVEVINQIKNGVLIYAE
ncbi:MAG: murein L,D-transpeptidase catalytic domain family protein [Bacteriovorax sp.]|nr:murein L,D-transpeptidase catalytic domain family protein [Bacteriovorax sp.]